MALEAIMDNLDGLSTDVAALYTERDGKYELSGISGVKTQADVDRLQTALSKERAETTKFKTAASAWGDLNPDEVRGQLDKIDEYKIAAEGKLDEDKLEQLVTARLRTQLSPVERQLATATQERDAVAAERDTLKADAVRRDLHDGARAAAVKSKVLDTAVDDVLMYAERIFEQTEDGRFVAKDGVGVTPGIEFDVWLTDMQKARPHWWPASQGGGANGGKGGVGGAKNPWTKDSWNMTDQGKYLQENGREKADQMAKAAGSYVGATSATR